MGVFNKRRTYDEIILDDNYTYWEVLREEYQGYHWGWWAFFLVIFWPAVIIMGVLTFTRKVLRVKLECEDTGRRDVYWVTEKWFNEFKE